MYAVAAGRPHLRVENRVLPAGPTVIDMLANSAFYYGMLRTLSEEDRPLWTKMSFAAAQQNFVEAARHGMRASLYWPGWVSDHVPTDSSLFELRVRDDMLRLLGCPFSSHQPSVLRIMWSMISREEWGRQCVELIGEVVLLVGKANPTNGTGWPSRRVRCMD